MTKLRQFLGGLICALCGWMLTACSSDEDSLQIPEGKGYVKLNLTADTGFQTKATLDEEDYKDLNNYTVQILKNGKVLEGMEWNYANVPEGLIELTSGAYELKAFYGDPNFTASTQDMYVEGKKIFNVDHNQTEVFVTCKPVCGKVTVQFDSKMADYFNDYSISFNTKALGESIIAWTKDSTDPIYMKVENNESITATYNLVDKTGKIAEKPIVKTYDLSPQKHLILKVVPVVSGGNLGITITVDDKTNDVPVDITVPSDWI